MRISEYENEDALDLLADIIEPAAIIMADPKIPEIYKSKPAIFVASYILKNHKESAIEIMAALHREDAQSFRFNVATLLTDVVDLLNDPMVKDLFTSQGQNTEEKDSGSATESTEGEGR